MRIDKVVISLAQNIVRTVGGYVLIGAIPFSADLLVLLLQPFNLKKQSKRQSSGSLTKTLKVRHHKSRCPLAIHSPRTPTLRHCDVCDSNEANALTHDDAETDNSRQGRQSVKDNVNNYEC